MVGAQKACGEGCKGMGRRSVQWLQQSSTANSQVEKSRCRNILKGPIFQSMYDCFCYRNMLGSGPYISKDCKISANLLAKVLKQRSAAQAAYTACDAVLRPELSCCGFGLIPTPLAKPFPDGTG